jgi:hypothetical protein
MSNPNDALEHSPPDIRSADACEAPLRKNEADDGDNFGGRDIEATVRHRASPGTRRPRVFASWSPEKCRKIASADRGKFQIALADRESSLPCGRRISVVVRDAPITNR